MLLLGLTCPHLQAIISRAFCEFPIFQCFSCKYENAQNRIFTKCVAKRTTFFATTLKSKKSATSPFTPTNQRSSSKRFCALAEKMARFSSNPFCVSACRSPRTVRLRERCFAYIEDLPPKSLAELINSSPLPNSQEKIYFPHREIGT